MEIVETVCYITQLRYSSFERIGVVEVNPTHEGSTVYLRVFAHVCGDPKFFHTIIHNLER